MQAKKSAVKVYDAIVVGSGATGGWAAKVLTERGLSVLVLEAGRNIDPAKDYHMLTQPYELKYRGLGARELFAPRQPIQSRCYASNEYSRHLFVDDLDNPYSTPDEKPFWWIRGRQVGGRSLTWGRQSYRLSDYDFQAASRDGHGENWPFRYAELAPFYEEVENFVGISGSYENLPQLPDSNFLPPMALTCGEQLFKKGVESKWDDRKIIIGRAAILTKSHKGRAACHWCGHCDRGCDTHSYFSSNGSTLPAAAKTGRMTLRPNSVVREIIVDANSGKAKGVRVVDQNTKQDYEYMGKTVVLCASTLESTRILMLSKSRQHPEGIGASSGALGHYLMDHMFQIGAGGIVEQLKGMDYDYSDGRANGIYVPRFRNIRDKRKDFIRGYGMQGGVKMGYTFAHAKRMPSFGTEFKKLVRDAPSEITWGVGAWCEMLPEHRNHVKLNPDKLDKWGIPTLHIEASHGENEKAMAKDALMTAQELGEAAGFKVSYASNNPAPPGFCIHEVGTARMGKDPKKSVLNSYNQVWDMQNVFVTDGAAFVSQGCQNPTLTMMAITARACHHLADEMNKKNL